jgi:N-ethylmaleimide reductase
MNTEILLEEVKLNKLLTLKNKIVMAPMTRVSATDDLVPTPEMVEYYARRADAGLIVTEGTVIQVDALGHRNVPGIFSENQVKHWRRVTDEVHRKNGLIFSQLWHVGRVSHPLYLNDKLPIAPSETLMTGKISRSDGLHFGKSRTATIHEIKTIINAYADSAHNAMNAGFDGVEIHGANGYLIDQFLHYHTNLRNDEYGETPENMARFALEIVKACGEVIGFERVGIRLSPGGYLNEIIGDKKDADVFKYLLETLSTWNMAYIHTGNFNDDVIFPELNHMTMSAFIRKNYQGILIGCGNYSMEKAINAIAQKNLDLVAIGRPFIANPDLIQKIKLNKILQAYDPAMLNTLY